MGKVRTGKKKLSRWKSGAHDSMAKRQEHLNSLLAKRDWEAVNKIIDVDFKDRPLGSIDYDTLVTCAKVKLEVFQYDVATSMLLAAIEMSPLCPTAPTLLVDVFFRLKNFSRARPLVDRLREIDPSNSQYKRLEFIISANIDKSDEVVQSFERLVSEGHRELFENPEVLHALINTLTRDGRYDDAWAMVERFNLEESKDPPIRLSISNLLGASGYLLEAAEWLTGLFEEYPEQKVWQWNRALMRLSAGDLVGGWSDYECRWDWPEFPSLNRGLNLPTWEGEPLTGKSIVITAEQGLGDQIMFGTVIGEVLKRNPSRVRIEVSTKAIPLFQLWYPECEVVLFNNRDEELNRELEESFDFHSPMGSVCRVLMSSQSKIDNLSRRRLRISTDDKMGLLGRFDQQYPTKIGLAWRSGAVDGGRSAYYMNSKMAISLIESLPSEVGFVIVQYALTDEERELFAKYPNVFVPEEDLFNDLIINAKYCACCDLVVTAQTTLVHLSGVFSTPVVTWMGATSWVFLGREDYPWYTGIHVIRGDNSWSKPKVVERILKILKTALRLPLAS